MTFVIRPAATADGHAIALIHRASSTETYREWVPTIWDDYDVDQRAEQWSGWATADPYHLTVAEDPDADGTVIGFCASGPARGVDGAGEVYAVYIDYARHGEGIGQALMADALRWLTAAGYPECILWVAAPNTRTRAFYERLDFVLDTADDAVEDWRGIATVRYRRPLGP